MAVGCCCCSRSVWMKILLLTSICAVSSSRYVLHQTPKAFDQAGAHCLPGVLTTVSTQQEASDLLALLSGLAAPQRDVTVWVGLKKDRKDCVSPSLPLRGFRWTQDGSQDSQVSLWLEEPQPSCTAVRCAALRGTFADSAVTTWGLIPVSCKKLHGFICKERNGTTAGRPASPATPAPRPGTSEPRAGPAAPARTTLGPQPELPESFTPASAGTKPVTAEPKPPAPGLSDLDQAPESSPGPEGPPGPSPSSGPRSGPAPAPASCQHPVIPGIRSLSLDPDDGSRVRVECWSSVQLDLVCTGQPAEWRFLDQSQANFSDICQQCSDGFRKHAWGHCEDVDECSVSAPCRHTCLNTPGSYRCVCVDKNGDRHDDGAPPCDDPVTAESGDMLAGVLVPVLIAVAALVLLLVVVGVAVKCCLRRRSKKHAMRKAEKMGGLDSQAADAKAAA